MEIIGRLHHKADTQQVSEKFRKRDFVLITEENTPYPQRIQFQASGDKCDLLDVFQIGEELKVQFNVQGREWNGPQGIKWFNTLSAWRIERTGTAQTLPNDEDKKVKQDDNEDLPF